MRNDKVDNENLRDLRDDIMNIGWSWIYTNTCVVYLQRILLTRSEKNIKIYHRTPDILSDTITHLMILCNDES